MQQVKHDRVLRVLLGGLHQDLCVFALYTLDALVHQFWCLQGSLCCCPLLLLAQQPLHLWPRVRLHILPVCHLQSGSSLYDSVS